MIDYKKLVNLIGKDEYEKYEKVLRREFKKLKFTDDFMFGRLMSNERICRLVLEVFTGRKIGDIQCIIDQRALRITSESKGVRYDVYVETDIYVHEIEMQQVENKKIIKELPKRSRFYQGMLDLNVLKKGEDYDALKDSYVIFICTFDPFGEGLCCYNYENTCRDGSRRFLEDGRNILFFNTKGTIDNVSKEVHAMLNYMETGEATDETTRYIDDQVEEFHFDGAALADYLIRQMQQKERDMMSQQRGLEQGLKQGLKQGLEQGIEQGIEQGLEQGLEQGKISMLKQLIDSNILSVDEGAKQMGMTKDVFEEKIKEVGRKLTGF